MAPTPHVIQRLPGIHQQLLAVYATGESMTQNTSLNSLVAAAGACHQNVAPFRAMCRCFLQFQASLGLKYERARSYIEQ
jgi:hypothetical protein